MLKIRPATKSDAFTLMQVHREAVFAKAKSHYDQTGLEDWSPGPTPERIAQIERDISDPDHLVLVIEADDQIIGFSNVSPSKNKLFQLYARPNSIGRVGQILLAEIERQAFNSGAQFLELEASLNAEAFYKANGYAALGRADHVSKSGHRTAIIQMKKVQPNIKPN